MTSTAAVGNSSSSTDNGGGGRDVVAALWIIGAPVIFIVGICGNALVLTVTSSRGRGVVAWAGDVIATRSYWPWWRGRRCRARRLACTCRWWPPPTRWCSSADSSPTGWGRSRAATSSSVNCIRPPASWRNSSSIPGTIILRLPIDFNWQMHKKSYRAYEIELLTSKNVQCVSKKQYTWLIIITSANVDRFSSLSLSDSWGNVMHIYYQDSHSHLKYVSTLPCES